MSSSGARQSMCPRCRGPVLRQLVGRRAALDVTADARYLSAAEAKALRRENRLDWCLRQTRDGVDLRWADCHARGATCPHPHVIDHECTAPAVPARAAAPSRNRTTQPVPPGQLTL
ncbi:hypothetical protein ACIQPP_05405 [Streptomyces violaceusniger]|uniref:hypothetical protein n=1 Tax=Streptomyces violaceusniger TaxID=68280 RepID=UPI001F382316|nr:hypothetical protein [Streptomyces hygroscopicus]